MASARRRREISPGAKRFGAIQRAEALVLSSTYRRNSRAALLPGSVPYACDAWRLVPNAVVSADGDVEMMDELWRGAL